MSFVHRIVSAQAVIKALTRVCPACGKKQTVASAHKNQTVTCRHCGKTIAPPKAG
jgi:ribosomal protein S27E